MNNCVLIGRMTRDADLRYLPGTGAPVANFSIAVDKELNKDKRAELEAAGKPTADFINIVAWGRTAEAVANYTGKGLKIAVQGRIQSRSWVADDGDRRYATEVVADRVEFLEWKENNIPDGFMEVDVDEENVPF
mgnify:FL=1